MKKRPGPLAPPARSLPSRKMTALSYSCTTCTIPTCCIYMCTVRKQSICKMSSLHADMCIHPYVLYQSTQSQLKVVQSIVNNEDFLWLSFNNRGLLLWHPRYLISYEISYEMTSSPSSSIRISSSSSSNVITLTHMQREKGRVARKRRKETAVKKSEQMPGPSGSSENKFIFSTKFLCVYLNCNHHNHQHCPVFMDK